MPPIGWFLKRAGHDGPALVAPSTLVVASPILCEGNEKLRQSVSQMLRSPCLILPESTLNHLHPRRQHLVHDGRHDPRQHGRRDQAADDHEGQRGVQIVALDRQWREPPTAVNVVRTIGRKRTSPAFRIAASSPIPWLPS